jgi:excisionase family DNA binding protein
MREKHAKTNISPAAKVVSMPPKMAFSIDEAAQQANVCRDSIYAAIRSGQLEAKKAGRRTLVMADALRRYLDALPSLQLGE